MLLRIPARCAATIHKQGVVAGNLLAEFDQIGGEDYGYR
jgi:hypothetical protein